MAFDYMTSLVEERDALRKEIELWKKIEYNSRVENEKLEQQLDIAVEAIEKAQKVEYLVAGAIALDYKYKIDKILFEALKQLESSDGPVQESTL